MKKYFEEPECTVERIAVEDVIATSFTPGENELPGGGGL